MLKTRLCNLLLGLMLPTLLGAEEGTKFNYEFHGSREGVVIGTGGGFYSMAGRFHVTLVHAQEQGENVIVDFATKTVDPLTPGQYSIGMFGQIAAGLEFRCADTLIEFDGTGGRLVIHSNENGVMKGEFDLQATDMDNGGNITVAGTFDAGSAYTQSE
jgi:hypothetical protein